MLQINSSVLTCEISAQNCFVTFRIDRPQNICEAIYILFIMLQFLFENSLNMIEADQIGGTLYVNDKKRRKISTTHQKKNQTIFKTRFARLGQKQKTKITRTDRVYTE